MSSDKTNKTKSKKLQLNRETLRRLSTAETRAVHGGIPTASVVATMDPSDSVTSSGLKICYPATAAANPSAPSGTD